MVKAGRYPGDVFKVGRNRTLWATCLPNREIRCAHVDAVRVTDFPRRFTPKHFATLSQWPAPVTRTHLKLLTR